MDRDRSDKRGFSRRDFLKGVPAGIAGALALGALSNKMLTPLFRRGKRAEFPEDSIFAPAKDKHIT